MNVSSFRPTQIGRCDCCDFAPVAIAEFPRHARFPIKITDKPKKLCEICAGTEVGIASEYPNQQPPGQLRILKAIAFAGNVARAAAEGARRGLPVKDDVDVDELRAFAKRAYAAALCGDCPRQRGEQRCTREPCLGDLHDEAVRLGVDK